jgi:glucosamine-phosphate N-acetyltransferase
MSSGTKINFVVRGMEEGDLHKGFFETLSDLTEVGEISNDFERAKKIFRAIKANPLYKIFVAVKDDGEVIGLTTLLIEQKFIHDGGKVGHIEDVVTRKEYGGIGIGAALIHASLAFAQENDCYKVILDCSENNISFYEKIGFRKHSIGMRYDIK